MLFTIITIIWLLAVSFILYRINRHNQQLSKSVGVRDLKQFLGKVLKDQEIQAKKIEETIKGVKTLEQEGNYHIQKIGLVRFNPYGDTGGDQSFCLAALDNYDNGFVISSLHGRGSTRLYAKPIKKGKTQKYELSTEEKEAIKNAKKIK